MQEASEAIKSSGCTYWLPRQGVPGHQEDAQDVPLVVGGWGGQKMVSGTHPVVSRFTAGFVLRVLLVGLRGSYAVPETELGLATCKTSAFPTSLDLGP